MSEKLLSLSVDPTFNCLGREHDFEKMPLEFLELLERINAKRLATNDEHPVVSDKREQ
jgi:hypothetical protein